MGKTEWDMVFGEVGLCVGSIELEDTIFSCIYIYNNIYIYSYIKLWFRLLRSVV